MNDFTPLPALIGGLLIGLSASLLLLFNGRILGVSGIASGVVIPRRGEVGWRLVFLAGLLAGGFFAARLMPSAFASASAAGPRLSWIPIIAAGFLVGFGTRLANGCTSGHGVCGLPRLSRRSLAATLTFMATGALTVFVTHHLRGGTP